MGGHRLTVMALVAAALLAGCGGGSEGPSARIDLPFVTPVSVGAGPAGVFVAGFGQITQIDPVTNTAGPRVPFALRLTPGQRELRRLSRELLDRLGGAPQGGNPPVALAVGDGAAWWGRPGIDLVARSVPPAARIAATVPLTPAGRPVVTLGDEGPVAATAVPGVVWIVDATAGVGTLSRIDPAAGRVDLRIELAEEPTAVAADADRVLVTDADRRLQAYSARTGARLDWSQRFGINLNDDVVIGAGAAWYIDSDRVSRASLADPSESSTTGLEGDAVALAFGEGAVWAAVWEGEGRGSVVRLDPATGEVTRTVRMPGRADDVAAGAGAVWAITCCEDPRLARIDP